MKYVEATCERSPSPSLPVRGAWIEILAYKRIYDRVLSLPVRGAWIEMSITGTTRKAECVAPRKGSVD